MGVIITPSPARRGPTVLYAVAAIVVCAAVLAVVLGMNRPIEITVDGKSVSVPRGTTVGDLAEQKLFVASRGDLLSVKEKVLTPKGGEQPTYSRNGEFADRTQEVYAGDRIDSHRGRDVTEGVVMTKVAIEPKTKITGKGPIEVTVREGREGLKEVRTGQISKVVLSEKVLKEPTSGLIAKRGITKKDKVVALTFDDGPWPLSTQKILDILSKERVKATFFMLGVRARQSPISVKRIIAEGHSVGDHSLTHVYQRKSTSGATIRKEIIGGKKAIEKYSGTKVRWYRPPGGHIDARGRNVCKREKMSVVMWDVDSSDWRKPGTSAIVNNVLSHMRPGAVVLMHDGGGNRSQTVAALGPIIRSLKKSGYTFVTLDELASNRTASR